MTVAPRTTLVPSAASARYADWKAPDEDGQTLIWPAPAELLRQTGANRALLSACWAPVQGVPLRELRAAARAEVGHAGDAPLVATGHQTELYHTGVWVKDVLIDAVARKLGGRALHMAVDTDSPKHLHLRWPGGSMPISDDPRLGGAAWAGLLAPPTPGHLEALEDRFEDAALGWDFRPEVGVFLAALGRAAGAPGGSAGVEEVAGPGGAVTLPAALTAATLYVSRDLGLRHQLLLMGRVWASPPFLTFAHHLAARADAVAGHYNAALHEYRAEQGITSPGRPMPDLHAGADAVEAPFWVDDLRGGARERMRLGRRAEGFELRPRAAGGEGFLFRAGADGVAAARALGAWFDGLGLRIAPRALTLTTFARLFLADQFVHGIGGGRYDRVADRLIERLFGVAAPAFAVTTATLYFPAARGRKRVSLRPLLQEGRRLRHGSFSREKRDMAAAIAGLPRGSRERRERFFDMHRWLARQADSPALQAWQARLEQATREQLAQKAVFDRELFFAVQPQDRLRGLVARYHDSVLNADS